LKPDPFPVKQTESFPELRSLLDWHLSWFNRPEFILHDPISIPHRFTRKEDIEVAGLLTALISWGNRTAILKKASTLMTLMQNSPYDFICAATEREYNLLREFTYRTLQGEDCEFLARVIQHIYRNHGGLEQVFSEWNIAGAFKTIGQFRKIALEVPHLPRSEKHLADPSKGSAAKRINMFIRWMVRNDQRGVDFGLWSSIDPANLICPLDLHTGRMARKLQLLHRKASDWKAAEELTAALRIFDPSDPVKYDIALFGLSVSAKELPREIP